MGRALDRLFGELGHTIVIADVDTSLRPVEAAKQADVVVIGVPIRVTEDVIREIGPHVREDALMVDVTSIKGAPMRAMLDATKASVAGTHPMFGPGVHGFEGQRVVLCPGRGEGWLEWLRRTFASRGMLVTEATPDAHDRAMAIVQVLLHYQTQVLGLAIARSGVPLEESLAFTSPAYLLEAYVAARHFAQAPDLYGPIEMLNPRRDEIAKIFVAAANEVADILRSGDQKRFDAVFDEVRAYFGDFSDEALEQSGLLIDRLIELGGGRAASARSAD
jgi:prephenate dehydrogenase